MTPQTDNQMNTPQTGRLEPPTVDEATIAQLKAQLEAAQKELQAFKFNGDYSVRLAVATVTEKLQKERDAAQAKCAEMRRIIGAIKHAIESAQPIPWLTMCERMAHALSDDGKQDFVPKAELDRLKAVNAEMREAIETLMGPCRDQIDCYLHRQFPATVGHVPLREYFNRLFASANTECGKDYVSKEQVKPLVEALEMAFGLIAHAKPRAFENGNTDPTGSIDEGEVIAGRIYEQAKQALAHAKQIGL